MKVITVDCVFTYNYCLCAFAVAAPSTRDQTWSSRYQRRLSFSADVNFPLPVSAPFILPPFVTLWVTEPARGSQPTSPRRDRLFAVRGRRFGGSGWPSLSVTQKTATSRLLPPSHPASQPCRRCDSAVQKNWPSYCSLTRLNYKQRLVAAFRLFRRLI